MSEWLPIDTAPKDGTAVLIHLSDTGNIIAVYWTGGKFCWKSVEHETLWCPSIATHWMPLPEPPSEGAPQ
jgi:hypothetical protein